MRLTKIIANLTRFIWEEFCIFCETPGSFVCGDCESALPFVCESYCTICGRPFPNMGVYAVSVPVHPCGHCLKDKPAYDKHRALMSFEGVARDLVHNLKYKGEFWIRKFYADHLERLKGEFVDVDAIVPIPLHRMRLVSRGFNQSAVLAGAWREVLCKPLSLSLLSRRIDTITQTGLTRKQRSANLKGAFQVGSTDEIVGKKILLVDDVHTTGATLNAASRILKKAGAAAVFATSLAVVPLQNEV
jgi:ComF family protein